MITSLITLLPIPVGLLLADRFPVDVRDNFGAFFWLPALSLLAAHWLCVLLTAIDPGNKERNQKPLAFAKHSH